MTKKVRFFAGVEIDKDEKRHTWSADAWQRFVDLCADDSQTFRVRGREITGKSEQCFSPAVTYLHLTKNRELLDWPEVGDIEGTISNLATKREQTGIASILEYTYLLPVAGTPYIALFRSSSGPLPSAIASWIALKRNLMEDGSSFELQPVLRNNARQKLNESLGVKSLEIRFEGKPNRDSQSVIERAAAEAVSVAAENDYANISVDLRISTGRATVVGESTENIRKEALTILSNNDISSHSLEKVFGGVVTKLRANTIQASQDSDKSVTEQVDFIKESLTEDVNFGSMRDDEMTPEIILSGMMEAVSKFRTRAGEYN